MTKELEQLYIDRIEALRKRVEKLESIVSKKPIRKIAIVSNMNRPNKLGKVKDLLENEREV